MTETNVSKSVDEKDAEENRAAQSEADAAHERSLDEEVDAAFNDAQADEQTGQGEAEEPSAYTKAEQAHYQEILDKEKHLVPLASKMERTKEQAKTAKSLYDDALADLRHIIGRGPDEQQKLPGMEDADEPASDAWREFELSDAGIGGGLAKALAEAEFEMLGQVTDYLNAGNNIDDIKGIGLAKAEEYENVMEAFWGDHPEFCETETEEPKEQGEDPAGD